MSLEGNIEWIARTGKRPGVRVKGSTNRNPKDVFNDLNRLLSEFYDRQNRTFVSSPYDENKARYNCPVYDDDSGRVVINEVRDKTGEVVNQHARFERPRVPYASIAILRNDSDWRPSPQHGSDFPTADFIAEKENLTIFFNFPGKAKDEAETRGLTEREEFIRFAARRGYDTRS